MRHTTWSVVGTWSATTPKILKGSSLLNISEGNILSPLLSNIYFTKLDEKVESIIRKYHKVCCENATSNDEYYKAIALSKEETMGKTMRQLHQLKKRKTLLARKKGLLDDKY